MRRAGDTRVRFALTAATWCTLKPKSAVAKEHTIDAAFRRTLDVTMRGCIRDNRRRRNDATRAADVHAT